MPDYERFDRFIDSHLDASLAELSRLVAQPSVAAQGIGLAECAALVERLFQSRGFSTEIVPTPGSPVVVAERRGSGPRTLLFYNHYDVQPPEPLELWDSPPFEPARRDGKLFGRGVSDDKGHITARLLALDALLENGAELPCTIKFVVEGEEEVSSVHLGDAIRQLRDRLRADACVWEFGFVDHEEAPVLHAGLRGICYVELSVETASHDAHSGIGGSIFPNAAWRLTWALASLKGQDEKIRIPGFYDDVKPPSHRDRELMAALPDVADEYRSRYGLAGFLKGLTGGVELSVAEVFEPTCTICGLDSGYQGKGSKTVLPAKARAKVDFRLVPDQTPARVLLQLRSHLDTHGFKDVHVQFLGGEAPGRTDPDDPFLALVCETARGVFDRPMRLVPMVGGSGPNHVFIHELGVADRHGGARLSRHPCACPQREHPHRSLRQTRQAHGQADHGIRQVVRAAHSRKGDGMEKKKDREVLKYSVAWNPNTKSGYALIIVKGSDQPVRVPVSNAGDLAALAVVLREAPVYLRDTGMIYSGWESVED